MLYLSRVEIDSTNRRKLKNLTHLGAYHDWVEKCFPEEIKNHERQRHLWRIDDFKGKSYLLLLSSDRPDEEELLRYGVDGTVMVRNYDEFMDKLNVGQIMMFKLTANPTHCKDGKVYPHVTVEQQSKWLLDRAKGLGFDIIKSDGIPSFSVINREWQVLKRKGGRSVKLSKVTYQGYLKIVDLDLFRSALLKGVGREKAFGMGLMTVIPKG